ncbi:MAG: ATP synthase F1 subunit gamma [Acholeplasmataceae bacterium]
MPLKEIKNRIDAIKKTASITQAMHNIALSKLKRATELFDHTKAFLKEIDRVLREADSSIQERHRLTEPNEGKHELFVIVTSDRGLCGSYHNQLFKAFSQAIAGRDKETYQVFVLGKKGYHYALKRGLPLINRSIIHNRDDLSTVVFREYAHLIKEAFLEGFVDRVTLYYNHYVNTGTQKVTHRTILPIEIENEALGETYAYDVDPIEVLEETIDVYIESSIFSALADAKLSEHAARMVAMKNATDNAKDIVAKLNTAYHRARQQEITSEIIDIVNGSSV